MKQIVYLMFLFVLSIALVGCMSIPVGDQTLKLSTDGVELVENEGEEAQENPAEEQQPVVEETEQVEDDEKQSTEEQVDKEKAISEEEKQEDVDEEKADKAQGNEDENENENENEEKVNRQCVEQDISLLTDDLIEGFYIPDCAELTNVSKSNTHVDAYVKVEGDWQDTTQAYKEYFGDRMTSENQNISEEYANLIADFGEDEGKAEVRISQDGEFVSMRIIYTKASND